MTVNTQKQKDRFLLLTPLYVFIVSFRSQVLQRKHALCHILSRQLNFSTEKHQHTIQISNLCKTRPQLIRGGQRAAGSSCVWLTFANNRWVLYHVAVLVILIDSCLVKFSDEQRNQNAS